MSVEVGSKAPNFTLKTKTADGMKEVTLSDNFGKKQTVLLFVPLAFTPVCTKELCTATEDYDDYSKLDATVYGISVDSPFTLDAWAKASKMSITLLSDWHRKASEEYGILTGNHTGIDRVSMRSAFVINKDGEIAYKWVANELGEFPDFRAIKQALQAGATANT